jgi:hypothetical protein
MKKLALAVALAALAAAPLAARAGVLVEVSAGSGARVDPSPVERIPTNLMVAPGFGLGPVKLQVGLLGNLGDVKDSKFDLALRPMVTLKPPVFPMYLRGILAVNGLVEGPTEVDWGAALGTSFGLFGLGAFLEAGVLPQDLEVEIAPGVEETQRFWLVEGRLGLYWD